MRNGPDVIIRGLAELQNRLADPETVALPLRKLLGEVAAHLRDQVRSNLPVDTGAARDSVVVAVDPSGLPTWARVSSPLEYVAQLEEGSPPHWPPVASLEPWARRHGFPAGCSGAFLVARAIARRGTRGRHMFANAVAESQGKIDDLAQRAGREIVERLER